MMEDISIANGNDTSSVSCITENNRSSDSTLSRTVRTKSDPAAQTTQQTHTIHFNNFVNVVNGDHTETKSLLNDSNFIESYNSQDDVYEYQHHAANNNHNSNSKRQRQHFNLYNSINKTSSLQLNSNSSHCKYSTLDANFYQECKKQNVSITVLDYSSLEDFELRLQQQQRNKRTDYKQQPLQQIKQQLRREQYQEQEEEDRSFPTSYQPQEEQLQRSKRHYHDRNNQSPSSTPRVENYSKQKRQFLQCTMKTKKKNQDSTSPCTRKMRYFIICLILIVIISNTWWHRHIQNKQKASAYYFWNLMYNNHDDIGANHNLQKSIFPRMSSSLLSRWRLQSDSITFDKLNCDDVVCTSSSSSTSTASDDNDNKPYSPPTVKFNKYSSKSNAKLVIAGKMTVLDGYCNIAELSLTSGEWSLKERMQLSLYDSYSGGEVYSMLVNHTFNRDSFSLFKNDNGGGYVGNNGGGSKTNEEKSREQNGQSEEVHGAELIVVGAFDTTDRNSQTTYCSVGAWNGVELSKVGEGLCNSALSKGMKITSAALAGPDDVYVAGSFHTQVWNGLRHEFVNIYNIAHYNAVDKVWLPLPVGQISCSWCKVTVLAMAYDSKRRQLHVAGKFNAIDGLNIPSGLAIYDLDSGHLVAHPGGGLTMFNETQDGVGTALQLDEEAGVLYVMGAFQRLGASRQLCFGLAAYEISTRSWTCLADAAHTVMPSGGGNMLLTPYGLMVAGRITSSTTWPDSSRPYTIALLNTTRSVKKDDSKSTSKSESNNNERNLTLADHEYRWSWLPGFHGHDEPLHSLANGFGDYEGTVFIAGDNLVAAWYNEERTEVIKSPSGTMETITKYVPLTEDLSKDFVQGSVMAIAQLKPEDPSDESDHKVVGYTIAVYFVALGALLGMLLALVCNRRINQTMMAFFFSNKEAHMNGISLDTLTYSAIKNTNVNDMYQRAMQVRCVPNPHFLQLIDPQDIILHRIIGEGTFGRVWSARLNSASVAVKEFVFAQAAVAGKSSQQNEIIEEIIGEAGMMAILRHPNVLQLFGCSLTAQAIWIVCELCSLGSLRQLLDDDERELPMKFRLKVALQVAEGMMYLHNQDPPIIHRDLKSHNIMVHETFTETTNRTEEEPEQRISENAKNAMLPFRIDQGDRTTKMSSEATVVAKIGDWGSARATLSGSRTMTHGVGTACWLAPEVIKHARSSKLSDVYSYGIILWELATREEVYAGLESTQIIANVANDNLRPPVPEKNPFGPLMVKCWCENPKDRLTFKEIVRELNQLLNDFDENEISSSGDEDGHNSTLNQTSIDEEREEIVQVEKENGLID